MLLLGLNNIWGTLLSYSFAPKIILEVWKKFVSTFTNSDKFELVWSRLNKIENDWKSFDYHGQFAS